MSKTRKITLADVENIMDDSREVSPDYFTGEAVDFITELARTVIDVIRNPGDIDDETLVGNITFRLAQIFVRGIEVGSGEREAEWFN
jgi:hypothetical protein